ncbi:MAG: hypothetical protein JNM84_17005 [Planctomycetes bacterium]|nr:hypothetical protein [Planctomycetota bacterium]
MSQVEQPGRPDGEPARPEGRPGRPAGRAAPDRSRASLRSELRAILAVYVFSALLPLIAGFSCSSEREHRLRRREQAPASGAPEAPPTTTPAIGEKQG